MSNLEYKLTNVIPDPPNDDPNTPEFQRWVYENFLHIQQSAMQGVTGAYLIGGSVLTIRDGIIINIVEVP